MAEIPGFVDLLTGIRIDNGRDTLNREIAPRNWMSAADDKSVPVWGLPSPLDMPEARLHSWTEFAEKSGWLSD